MTRPWPHAAWKAAWAAASPYTVTSKPGQHLGRLTCERLQELLGNADAGQLAYVHNAGLTALTAATQQGLRYGKQSEWDARLYEYFQKVCSLTSARDWTCTLVLQGVTWLEADTQCQRHRCIATHSGAPWTWARLSRASDGPWQ